jgi:hypothetical protein
MNRAAILTLPLLLLAACGSAPMKEGLWHVTIDNIQSNTCEAAGVDDSSLGVGQALTVTVTLSEDGKHFTTRDDQGGETHTYDLSGDSFSRIDSVSTVVGDSCYLRQDVVLDGTFTSDEFATITVGDDLSTEGDCSAFDVTGVPCSYEAEASWEYVGG